MRVLVDICHPAHFHFFRNPIELLKLAGHEVLVTSRDKEVTIKLLDSYGLDHRPLSVAGRGNMLGLLGELFSRNFALYKVVREFKPDVMVAIGGIFIAQVGVFTRVPSLVFYDTENAKLQNILTYPFASLVSVPECYESWVPKGTDRYQGYHELSYLHPDRFRPNYQVAVQNGLSTEKDTFLLRVVSWDANHDIGEIGWSEELLSLVIRKLEARGRVIVSSEAPLPESLTDYQYKGKPEDLHHVMAFCRLFVGESATMASESAVLGVPAIYAANTGRGYCNHQEKEYGLLRNIRSLDQSELMDAIDQMLVVSRDDYRARWERMIRESVDVADHVFRLILRYKK